MKILLSLTLLLPAAPLMAECLDKKLYDLYGPWTGAYDFVKKWSFISFSRWFQERLTQSLSVNGSNDWPR